jgi:hypothetical protein
MALALWIVVGLIGAGTVMAVHAVAADLAGGAVAIGALVAIIRSVIRRAGDAGVPPDPSVSR